MQFRGDIQGLRALAVMLVFFFHLNSTWLPGGFIGVDIFFVISGYLITSIMLHQKSKRAFSFISFYQKRIKRIVPAYYAMLLGIAIIGTYTFLFTDLGALQLGLVKSALFISNTLFAGGESYFGAKFSENPLLHTWSLAIEMQFYLLLPFIIIFIKNKLLPYLISGLIIVITFYASWQIFINGEQNSTYFSLLSRIPEFLIGSLGAIYIAKKQTINSKTSNILSITGLVIILISAFYISGKTPFPGITALIPCVGVLMMLISGKSKLSGILSSKIPVYIGELSYSIYLWHWPIMAFFRYRNNTYHFNTTDIILICILTALCSCASYYFIERYFKNKNNKTLAVFAIPFVFLFCTIIFMMPKLSPTKNIPEQFTQCTFGVKSHGTGIVETLGDTTSSNVNILLIGDSHALVLKPFLHYMGKHHNFSFKTLTCDTYPAIEGLKRSEIKYDLINPNQEKYFDKSVSLIEATKKLMDSSAVILLNCTQFDRIPSEVIAVKNLMKSIKPNQTLILINTFPKLEKNPLRINKGVVKNTNKNFDLIYTVKNKEIDSLAKTLSNVYYYDISESDIFSTAPFYNDTIMYYDAGHLNEYGSVALAKSMETNFMLFFNSILNR